MKLHERFADRGYHTCIATTFGIDFDAYEGVVLPRLRGAGCNNNLVLMDARMMTHALETASVLPGHAGRQYTLNGVASRGVFHSKIILQLGRMSGRLIVGSANLTAPGLGGNLEVAGIVSWAPDDTAGSRLIASAWQYLSTFIDTSQDALSHQVEWIRRRTPWLFDATPADAPLPMADGGDAAFLAGNGAEGIGDQFAWLVGSDAVVRLVSISPYWDLDLDALRYLSQSLNAKEVSILVGGLQPSLPVGALEGFNNVGVYGLGSIANSRFAHAKVLIAQTKDADHVLFGSANCTIAALGRAGFGGINDEACLYRRMGPGGAIEALALANALTAESRLDKDSLPPYALRPEIPLEAAFQRYPGRFEATEDRVTWWPSPGFTGIDTYTLELLYCDGSSIPCQLDRLSSGSDGCLRFGVSGTRDVPSFARVRIGNDVSAPAVVVVVDAIRSVVREARGRHEERVARQLATETEEGLWLLEAFEVLADAEADETASEEPGLGVSRKRASSAVDKPESPSRTLSYEEFIAGRKLRGEAASSGRSDFAGSELALVRHCLNRLLGLDFRVELEAPAEDDSIRDALAMTDEVDDSAVDDEFSGDGAGRRELDKPKAEEDYRIVAARNIATRDKIEGAVLQFSGSVLAKAVASGLSHQDILRLRVILMIVLAAARPVRVSSPNGLRPIQVLNPKGDMSWPRLLGKLLFVYFAGKDPAIKHLKVSRIHNELPIEYVECWALCLWIVNACKLALLGIPAERALAARINALAEQIYTITGIDKNQLEGEQFIRLYAGLTHRFARPLSLDPEELSLLHHSARNFRP